MRYNRRRDIIVSATKVQLQYRILLISQFSHKTLASPNTTTNIHTQEAKAMKELAKDDDIVILPRRATVVMDRKDYSAKILMMLGDRDTYQLMAIDPTTSLENRMNSVSLRLRQEGRLSGKTYYHLPDVPLHPIVSFVSSPTYALSKFLASLLSPIVGLSDSYVRNSQQIAQFITTQNVPDSEVLVSFDVVSHFTCVPTSRAIQVTCDHLMNDPSLPDRTSLTVDDICSLLQLCLEATFLLLLFTYFLLTLV